MANDANNRNVVIQMQQGVSACEGRLRSNNRAMVMGLTLQGLEDDECQRWLKAFREQQPTSQAESGNFEIEVELLHSDFSSIGTKSGSKRFPDSLNLVKFDGSILRTETDVVVAPGNSFVICTDLDEQVRVKGKKPDLGLRDLIRVSGSGKNKEIEISIKLATNITSKAHSGRHFVFRVNAREIDDNKEELISFWGVTDPFELFAKPTAADISRENSHADLRRQASTHSLASLASVASIAGLEAREQEEPAATQTVPQLHFDSEVHQAHKKIKTDHTVPSPDANALLHVLAAHGVTVHNASNPGYPAHEGWNPAHQLDYLTVAQPDNTTTN